MAFHAERGRTPTADEPIRLSLKPPGNRTGGISGGWWPRSRDILAELPGLISALDGALGTVSTVALDPDGWLPGPHRVGVGDQVVSVSRSDRRQAHTILVIGLDRNQLILLVIPPETSASAGAAALRIAGDERSTLGPEQILATGWLAGQNPRRAG